MRRVVLMAVIACLTSFGCAEPVPVVRAGDHWQRNPHPMEDPDVEHLPKDANCDCGTTSLDADCLYYYDFAASMCEADLDDEVYVTSAAGLHNESSSSSGWAYCGFEGIAYEHDNGRTVHATDLKGVVAYGQGDDDNYLYIELRSMDWSSGDTSYEDSCYFGGATTSCVAEATLTSTYRVAYARARLWYSSFLYGFRVCHSP